MRNFAVFILTHRRPHKQYTYKTLRKKGYTGKVYFIIDDEDPSAPIYRELYGKDVIIFNKKETAKLTDQGDNFNDRRTTTHCRNASFQIAKNLGLKYFIQLDDDYTEFEYRIGEHDFLNNKRNYYPIVKNMNKILRALLQFYKKTPALSVAMAQGGDFIGGLKSGFSKNMKLKRKCMNSFICSTDRPFLFLSRLNEDVNTYLTLGAVGHLFLTVPLVSLTQKATQSNSGGMSETYLKSGTYVKSFYSVMYAPSCVKVTMMGDKNKRLHHRITWKNAVPKILNQSHKK